MKGQGLLDIFLDILTGEKNIIDYTNNSIEAFAANCNIDKFGLDCVIIILSCLLFKALICFIAYCDYESQAGNLQKIKIFSIFSKIAVGILVVIILFSIVIGSPAIFLGIFAWLDYMHFLHIERLQQLKGGRR